MTAARFDKVAHATYTSFLAHARQHLNVTELAYLRDHAPARRNLMRGIVHALAQNLLTKDQQGSIVGMDEEDPNSTATAGAQTITPLST